ncbi:11521_t:CDS:2, partial [Funneliformis caledonium]
NQNNGNQDHNNENVISEEIVIQSHMMSNEEDQLEILENEEESDEGNQSSYIMSDKLFNEDQLEVLEDKEKDDEGSQDSYIIYDELFNEDQLEVLEDEEDNDEKDLIKGLQLLQIKDRHNISDATFNEILKVLEIPETSIYKLRKFFGKIIPFELNLIDCCVNSCVAFTGKLSNENQCPELIHQGNCHVYFPLKPPTSVSDIQYNPKNLPLRTHKNYIQDVTAIENMNRSSHKREVRVR